MRCLILLLCAWVCAAAKPIELRSGWTVQWNWADTPLSTGFSTIELPHLWEHHGCALYTMTYRVNPAEGHQVLLLPPPLNASQVWINGQSMGGSGTASCSAPQANPERRLRSYPVPENTDSIHIAILVSNYEMDRGGIAEAPRIGTAY